MKKINEAATLSTGNATSLMVFIELGSMIENQKGMIQVAFPQLGRSGIYKMIKGFSSNPTYQEKKDQIVGMSERFYNNSALKALYKTLAFVVAKPTKPEEESARMEDVNRVLSKIERMINNKLTDEEKELFSTIEDGIDGYGDSLNSNLDDSIQSSTSSEEPAPEEKPTEEPTPEETPKEEPKPEEKPKEEPKETPKEEPNTEKKPEEKVKTEEQFKSLIKRLVKETLHDYEKKFGKL